MEKKEKKRKNMSERKPIYYVFVPGKGIGMREKEREEWC